jgi:endonuclease/exonuclease/phosphatase family metal-dependent hydrolase
MIEQVRVLTLNLWGEQAPLDERLALIVESCRSLAPDVIALQEVRVVPGRVDNTAETIARALGMSWTFASATPWGGGDEGVAICSRFPIGRTEHAELPHAVPDERRVVLGAALSTPRGALPVFTTHLNYRLADGAKREDQVAAVDAFTAGWSTELPRILCGDFNAVPQSDEIRFLRGLHSHGGRRTYWQDAFEHAHVGERGVTWAARNPYTERLGWLEPDRRIDYVFVSPMFRDGRATVVRCDVVLDQPTPAGVWASDHFGLLADVRIAPRD